MSDSVSIRPAFGFSALLGTTLRIFVSNPGQILALNLMPSLPVLAFLAISGEPPKTGTLLDLTLGLASAILLFLTLGATIQGSHRVLQGGNFALCESLGKSAGRLRPMIGAGVLVCLLAFAGFAAFFVPGIMALCTLYVTLPACILEGKGAAESMERSAELTNGYRWQVFGLILLAAVPAFVVSIPLDSAAGGELRPVLSALSNELASLVIYTFSGILVAVCFVHLRMLGSLSESLDL